MCGALRDTESWRLKSREFVESSESRLVSCPGDILDSLQGPRQ